MKEPLYLVIFNGIPYWKDEIVSTPCSRRYIFSNQAKAADFVRHRTNSKDWITHPAYPRGSMMCRLQRGSSNRYQIVTVYVDDVYDEDFSIEGKE